MLAEMQIENPFHLCDPLGMLVGPMPAGDDDFTLRSIEMAAPVGDDAVAADGFGVTQISALAAVAQNGVVGNSLGERQFVQIFYETM